MSAGHKSEAASEYSALLLGAPELRRGDQRLHVRRRQVRALLFYLAHDLTPAPRERVAYLFWSERPEAAAQRNLTRLLSAARAELGDKDLLASRQGKVALDPERMSSDCVVFDRLAGSEDRAGLEQAEALYRGRFLEGFSLPDSAPYGEWLEQRQRQHERRYLELLLRLVDVCREDGDLAEAIAYARRYLAVDELAEHVHRRLITLYAANGDRPAAVRQFEACTLVLERELSVRPLPETRAAYEAAIAEDPAPAPVAPAWSVLPSLDLPLTGREEAWERLRDAHRRLQAGGLILISGEPGVGKSRLMQEFARASGSLVLAGNNPPGEQAVAYSAITEALRQALGHRERWQRIRPIWLAEAGRLLPEMGDVFPELPEPVEVEASQAQARLFEGISRCLFGLAGQGPVLLCLDDVHWADAGTMGWLTALAPRLAGSDVCILATYRSAHAGAVADVKRAYARHGLLAEAPLSRLTAAAVEGILEALPEPPPEPQPLAKRIHHATGGNTFFVLETVRALMEGERLADPPDDLPLAPTVEAAIGRRLERLNPLARQVLETAAVLASGLRVDLLQETAGRSDLEVAEGLDEAVGRQLLVDGETRGFSHDLVRQVTYEEISPWRRRILHRRAAGALEGGGSHEGSDSGERVWAAVAHHYDAAGDAEEAIRCYAAAAAASDVYAHEEAIQHLRRAIALASDGAKDGVSAADLLRLHGALGDQLRISGAFAEAEAAYRAALALAPDKDGLRMAALECKLAATLSPQHREGDAENVFRRALARLEGEPPPEVAGTWQTTRLNLLLGLLDALYFQLRPEAMAGLREQTQALLDEVGTAEQHATFYARLSQMNFLQNRYRAPAENVTLARKSLARAQEAGSAWLIARQQFHVGFQLLWHGSVEEAEGRLRKALAMAEELGDSWLQTQSLVYLTILFRLLNRRAEVAVYLPRLVETMERISYPMYVGVSKANRAWLHYRAGEWQEAREQAEAALASWALTTYPFQWLAHWVLLAVGLRKERLEDAVGAARAMLDPEQRQLPEDVAVVLETAVAAWEAGEEEATRSALRQAVDVAEDHGYL